MLLDLFYYLFPFYFGLVNYCINLHIPSLLMIASELLHIRCNLDIICYLCTIKKTTCVLLKKLLAIQ
jgi:hypothetical protein